MKVLLYFTKILTFNTDMHIIYDPAIYILFQIIFNELYEFIKTCDLWRCFIIQNGKLCIRFAIQLY